MIIINPNFIYKTNLVVLLFIMLYIYISNSSYISNKYPILYDISINIFIKTIIRYPFILLLLLLSILNIIIVLSNKTKTSEYKHTNI
jgi:hypothetical protein